MPCPNCRKPFVVEQDGKGQCFDCGWFVYSDGVWKVCKEPSPEPEPASEPDPAKTEPDPAALEPDPAALEPDPAKHEPSPVPQANVKEYLGGLVTVTEIDE